MIEGLTLGQISHHYARSGVTRDRVVLTTGSESYTWGRLDDGSNRLARALGGLGVGVQDKVAVLLWNDPAYYELMFAVAKAGAVIVPLNARLVARELAYYLERSHAKVLVTSPGFATVVREAVALAGIDIAVLGRGGGEPGWLDYDELLAGSDPAPPTVEVSPDAPFWMPFTSGTTGAPKAALIPHRNLVTEWNALSAEIASGRDDTYLLAAPIFGGVGFVFGLCSLYRGGRVVLMEQFDPARALQLIEEHRVTVLPAAPTMLSMMIEADGAAERDVSSVRAILAMGSALSTGLRRRVERYFAAAEGVYHPYGSTELGTCACIHPSQQEGRDGSVGQGFLGAEVRLLDAEGNDVAPGEVGEIYTRGKVLSVGYFENEEATAASRRGDWVTSNDLGRFDEDGFLYVVDRTKDMIVTGGLNVYSNEVEEVISTFDGVGQVAVIGVPDPKWGEAVTAYVTAAAGAEVDLESLRAHCTAQLADFKRPKSVVVVDGMPLSSTGKILKRVLRDDVAAGRVPTGAALA
ncbi:class I adenylate-forming enzyme family protein [Pseudonocardia xishanensis]|uniref:Long-chain fatty acid--CoA ligase n=1 Tax=Pseudonocardia xishanensis TaxID=630995 RepID=A0ABP8RUX2_9PSEU